MPGSVGVGAVSVHDVVAFDGEESRGTDAGALWLDTRSEARGGDGLGLCDGWQE
jgi:hypothetical protein